MRKTFYVALEHDPITCKSTKLLGGTKRYAKPKEIIEETLSYLPICMLSRNKSTVRQLS